MLTIQKYTEIVSLLRENSAELGTMDVILNTKSDQVKQVILNALSSF